MTSGQHSETAPEGVVADAELTSPDDDAAVMAALRSHVPLTLLCDLTDPQPPDSAAIAHDEGGDADWLAPPASG
jgi:hypothetical protein